MNLEPYTTKFGLRVPAERMGTVMLHVCADETPAQIRAILPDACEAEVREIHAEAEVRLSWNQTLANVTPSRS